MSACSTGPDESDTGQTPAEEHTPDDESTPPEEEEPDDESTPPEEEEPDDQQASEESVVIIEGRSYTCDEITLSTCGPQSQAVFDANKDNIDEFVNGGRLGPHFLDMETPYEDVAYAGIMACTFSDPESYVAYMQENYMDMDGTLYLPVWFQRGTLCPDGLEEGSLHGPDFITP